MNLADQRARLTRAQKADKLEKLLAAADEGLPWNDFVLLLQIPAFLGAAIQVAYMANNIPPGADGPPAEEVLWLMVLVLLGTAMHFLHPLFRNRIQKIRHRVRTKGIVLPAAIVQANSQWGEVDDWMYGSVLISLDPEVTHQPKLLVDAADKIFAIKHVDRSTLPHDQRAVAWSLYNELAPIRFIKVPESLTPGLSKCIMACVLLPPEPLREGPLLFALALPNELDPNAIAMLPEATRTC